jgi:hypothetical protein
MYVIDTPFRPLTSQLGMPMEKRKSRPGLTPILYGIYPQTATSQTQG